MMPYKYDLPSTTPPPGYVDIAITHNGICRSTQIDGSVEGGVLPLIPGHEIVGEIVAIGGGVTKFAVGDRAWPLASSAVLAARASKCESFMENVCPKITKTYAGPGKDKGGFHRSSGTRPIGPSPRPMVWHRSSSARSCARALLPTRRSSDLESRSGKVGVIGIGGLGHIALQLQSIWASLRSSRSRARPTRRRRRSSLARRAS